MFQIKPISDLRNKARSISNIVHQRDEPVVITKNGEGDMVVMSYDHFQRLQTRLALYEQLAVAEAEDATGAETFSLDQVFGEIRKSLHV